MYFHHYCNVTIYQCASISDSKKFEAWLEEVCKKLPPKSVLIMDNASYHCRLVSIEIFSKTHTVLKM